MPSRSRHLLEAGAGAILLAGLLLTRHGSTSANLPNLPHGDGAGHPRLAPARPNAATGRDANSPSEIPARFWLQILKRMFAAIIEKRLMTEAAGITFYALLSIFPAIATLVSLYGLFADPAVIGKNLAAISGVVPDGGMQIIQQEIQRITSNGHASLGFGLLIALATSIWSSNQAMKAMVDSLNHVYEESDSRGFFKLTLLTLAFTFGGLIFIILAISGVVVLPLVLGFLGLSGVTDTLLRLARWPVLLLTVMGFMALLYRYGPDRKRARWRWVTWGSAAAALVWIIMSVAFSFYVSHFGSFNKTYGSLGAAVGFMTWIWLSALVVLSGAQLDAAMELQTSKDTTAGPARPIGQRGSATADRVAA